MGFPICVCCARFSPLGKGFEDREPQGCAGVLGCCSPAICLGVGFSVPTRSKHPPARGRASCFGSGGAGDQSSYARKTSSSCRNLNLLFSLCWEQPPASPLAVVPSRVLVPAPPEPRCVPSGVSWLPPREPAEHPGAQHLRSRREGKAGDSTSLQWPC